MKIIIEIMLILLIILLSSMWITGVIYILTGFGKWFYHDILEWHKPSEESTFDGCSFNSTCRYCGKRIIQDSQGNWFTYEGDKE